MEKRKFAIPAIALGFTALTLTGCLIEDGDKDDEDEDEDEDTDTSGGGSGIDGTWSLTSLSHVDYGEYELESSGEYNGYTYSYSTTFTMSIASPSATMTIEYYEYNSYYGTPYSGSYSYSGAIADNGGSYGIDFTDWLSMDCTQSGDSLACDGTGDYTGYSLNFGR